MEQFTIQDMLGSLGVNTRSTGSTASKSKETPTPQLEYLFEDEYKVAGPSLGSRICHGVGMSYLTGLSLGGLWGIFEGLGQASSQSARLRLNAVLNSCTRRGPFLGNNIALVAVIYNAIHGVGLKYSEREADILSTASSAATAGFLFRLSSGPKAATVAALTCGTIMGAIEFTRNSESYLYSIRKFYQNNFSSSKLLSR
jgi:Tim17/Tim22/Tim23/Pmp24 family